MKLLKTILLCALLAGAVVYSAADRAADPAFDGFRAGENPARPEDNGYLTMLGLTAPATLDAHAYGARIIQDFSGWWPSHRPGLLYWLAWSDRDDAGSRLKREQGQFHPSPAGPALALTPLPDGLGQDALDCWLMPRMAWQNQIARLPARPSCLTRDQLATYLEQNRIILNRYIAMLAAPRFYEPFGVGMIDLPPIDLTILNRLFIASLVSQARDGYAVESLRQWLAMQAALNRIAADQQQAGIKIAASSTPVQTLQAITESASGLIVNHQAEILAVLSPPAFGPGGLDLAASLRADYNAKLRFIDESLTWPMKLIYKPNLTKSRMAACTRRAMAATARPLPDILGSLKTDTSPAPDKANAVLQRFTNYLGRDDIRQCSQSALIETRMTMLREMALNAAWTAAIVAGVAPEAMAGWLQSAPADLHDPVTGKPFAWDPASNTIHVPLSHIAVFYPAPLPVIEMAPVSLVPPPPPR